LVSSSVDDSAVAMYAVVSQLASAAVAPSDPWIAARFELTRYPGLATARAAAL
jgi:hypothetical protein